MKTYRMWFTALCLAAASPAAAQPYIAGYLNPVTRAFHAQVPLRDSATIAYDGRIDATLTISVVSSITTGAGLSCSATFVAVDQTGHVAEYTVSQAATRAGSKATCALTIPYAFQLAANATYSVSYSAFSGSPTSGEYRQVSGPANPSAVLPVKGTVKLAASLTI